MNFRNRLALPAAFLFAAFALTGCQQGTLPAEGMAKAAPPAAPQTVAAGPGGALAAAVKSIHSPSVVATDEQLAAGQCSAKVVEAATGQFLPDPVCTPGAADPAVTQENIDSTICMSGYTATVRPPASNTDKVKAESLREYGQVPMKTTEYDHLLSAALTVSRSISPVQLARAAHPGDLLREDILNELSLTVTVPRRTASSGQAWPRHSLGVANSPDLAVRLGTRGYRHCPGMVGHAERLRDRRGTEDRPKRSPAPGRICLNRPARSSRSTAQPALMVEVTSPALKGLRRLPEKAAAAILEFVTSPLPDNPHRVSKSLTNELLALRTARHGAATTRAVHPRRGGTHPPRPLH